MASKSLVIVESPSKAKTIGKFLGSKYKVVASVGHVRDLPKSKLGIDIENNFEPAYIAIKGKGDVIKALRKEAKGVDKVLLATDPDREGEAISWHIAYLLGMDPDETCRVEFHEITKQAITAAIKVPRQINKNLVDAQQARRVLDRLVGYQISPLLWRKVKRGLSAGRVQSAALKIICDREKIILGFIPEEYWVIAANLSTELKKADQNGKNCFIAKLNDYKGKKITVKDTKENSKILKALEGKDYIVTKVEEKERKRRPYPPYTTSSLQQDASVRLGFFAQKTMSVAQQLYEGIDIKGEGTVGLITYIRTDSVRISAEAQAAAKDYIEKNLSKAYVGNNVYSNKKKDIQDAHEAIRPTYMAKHPNDIKDFLTKDQYNLYKLVWERFMASQMSDAKFDGVSVQIQNGEYGFKATGSVIKFEGFLKIYNVTEDEDNEKMLPKMAVGQNLGFRDIKGEQKFTQPPARFTEASLVKDLEEKNIGRPSTYAPIVGTLVERKYVKREKKSLIPTELGFVVSDLMETHFTEIVDAKFTAEMEDKLDNIEAEGFPWKKIIADFYEPFKVELEKAEEVIGHIKIEDELTDEVCEICGKPMAIKHGRFGEFIACSGYPECKNTKQKVAKTDVNCPICGKEIVVRKSKKGKLFYGCSGYPNCTQLYWNKPVNKECPKCKALLTEKKTKTTSLVCSNPECGHKE